MLAGLELFPDQVIAEGTKKVHVGPVQFKRFAFVFHKPDQQMLDRILDGMPVGSDGVSKFDVGIVVVVVKVLYCGFTSASNFVKDGDQIGGIVRFGGHTGTAIL